MGQVRHSFLNINLYSPLQTVYIVVLAGAEAEIFVFVLAINMAQLPPRCSELP